MNGLRLSLAAAVALMMFMVRPSCADEQGTTTAQGANPLPSPATGKNAEDRTVTPDELSKVYMNCLIEVDRTLAGLAKHAKSKAVQSEAQSQRAFCMNRKRDCQDRPQTVECRTFVEEFINAGTIVGDVPGSR